MFHRTKYLSVITLLLVAAGAHRLSAQTGTLSVLYALTSTGGTNPDGALVTDKLGNLYGPTFLGGASNQGTIYQLIKPSTTGGAWAFKVLHSFAGGSDGTSPLGRLIADSKGALYGTTIGGGSANAGTVFQLVPPSAAGGAWTEHVLYSFSGATDGASPTGGLEIDLHGELYGTTSGGGASGNGVVFQLQPPAISGAAWTYRVLYSFAGGTADGSIPGAGLSLSSSGSLYGTTYSGGTSGAGVAFRLAPPTTAGGSWTESVLYNFKCGSDAGNPDSSLIIGPGGVLYGTTAYCGVNNYGTAYQLTPPLTSGGAWTEKVIYTFSAEQAYPFGGVLLSQNTLLGTTYEGGTGGKGTVYELNPPLQTGSPWTVRILYDFSSLDNGFYPFTGLLLSGSTTAFGTTMQGGSRLNGIVFQLTF